MQVCVYDTGVYACVSVCMYKACFCEILAECQAEVWICSSRQWGAPAGLWVRKQFLWCCVWFMGCWQHRARLKEVDLKVGGLERVAWAAALEVGAERSELG